MSEREPPKLPELPRELLIRLAAEVGINAEDDTLTRWKGFVEPLTALCRSYGTACFEAGVKAGRESIFGKPEPQTQNRPEP